MSASRLPAHGSEFVPHDDRDAPPVDDAGPPVHHGWVGRPLLHDLEAEESLLGCILHTVEAMAAAERILNDRDDLYKPAHRLIYDAMATLVSRGEQPDPVTVAAELRATGQLEAAGGAGVLLALQVAPPATDASPLYARVIADLARRRRKIELARAIAAIAADESQDISLAVDLARLMVEDTPSPHGAAGPAQGLRAGLLSIEQLADLAQPDPLVEDVLHSNTLSCIYGKPGSAKTFVALDWALSIATSTNWQGLPVTQTPVLWVAAEGAEGLHKRIWAWMVEHQAGNIPADQFVTYPQPINLFDPAQAAALADLVAADGYGLVVVDTLARSSLGAEENSAKDMGLVVEAAESIRRASRAAVLLVHHTARNGENPRGSSAIDGAAYTLWKTELEADTVKLVNEKAKETARTRTMRLQLVPRLDSVVLHRASNSPEGLTEGPRQLLRLLAEMADDTGVPGGVWQRSCCQEGVAERSFWRWQKALAEQGFTANVGTDRQKRWTLTDLGLSALEDPCD